MTETVETSEAPQRRKPMRQSDLTAFAREGEALHVQNQLNNIVVFTLKVDGAEEVCEFQAKGDPNGADFMEVPSNYLKNANFRRCLQNEVLKVVDADDPDVLDAIEAQKAAVRSQRQAAEEADRFVEAQQPKSFSGLQCLAQEGRHQCTEYALTSSATALRERPPLCQKHHHQASQFVPEETGTFKDGKPEVRWTRVSIQGR